MASLNIVSQSQFTDLTEKTWVKMMNMVDKSAQSLYIVEDLAEHTGNTRRYDEIDVETFANVKPEGDDAVIANVQVGYNKTMTARRMGKEITITWEMRRYNKYPEVVAQLTGLVHFCPQKMELDLTHRITFATATSYTDLDGQTVTTTVGDGLALVSASHTLNGSSTTFSNVITGNPVFSKGGMEIAEGQAQYQIYSNLGERRVLNFNTIFSSDDPTTVNDIKQFLNSMSDVDQNNPNVTNVYYKKYNHVILKYLATTAAGARDSTKDKYWGLAAVGQGTNGWQSYLGVFEQPNLKTPAPGNNGEDVHNDDWTYGTRCSYGIVTVSPKGLVLSTGAGS